MIAIGVIGSINWFGCWYLILSSFEHHGWLIDLLVPSFLATFSKNFSSIIGSHGLVMKVNVWSAIVVP